MATSISLKHPGTGEQKQAFEGYSWTSLFFCAFPALLRGDLFMGLAVLAISIFFGIAFFAAGIPPFFSSGIIGGIWGFFYNRMSLEKLMKSGYVIVPTEDTVTN